ncbi:unnamed protein product [Arctogadus glacialis]
MIGSLPEYHQMDALLGWPPEGRSARGLLEKGPHAEKGLKKADVFREHLQPNSEEDDGASNRTDCQKSS